MNIDIENKTSKGSFKTAIFNDIKHEKITNRRSTSRIKGGVQAKLIVLKVKWRIKTKLTLKSK